MDISTALRRRGGTRLLTALTPSESLRGVPMKMPHFFVLAWIVSSQLFAADWPSWRGPEGLGVSTEKNLPTEWSKEKNIVWKISIPGKGASSPIILGDRAYVSTQTSETGLHLLAINCGDGKVLWDKEIGRGKLPANNLHNMATPTPVSDGEFVWVMFGTGDLACLDRSGKIVWQRNLVKEYGHYKTNHGYGSSPMLLDGKVFIACMHQGPSYLLAVDAKTGKNVWKKDRNLEPKDEAQDSYSSPIFFQSASGTQVIVAGAESVNAYDPGTGDQIWISGGMKVPHPYGRTIAGPTAGEGVILAVASGFQNRGYTVAIKPDGKGDVSETAKLWTSAKFSADCPTPIIDQGKVFSVRDDGMASCLDLKTGEPYWQERLFTANCKVSPVAGDGKVYFMNGQGNTYVVKASSKLEILSTNELNEATLSTPAISGGRIYLRTDGGLYCISQ
jgi:outer membrane protein assembly factor BamB